MSSTTTTISMITKSTAAMLLKSEERNTSMMRRRRLSTETKTPENPTELEAEEAINEKSLYICNLECKQDETSVAFVIRTVNISDLLSSTSTSPAPLRKVADYTRRCLPQYVGCGVLGSQIFITGGFKPKCDDCCTYSESDSIYKKDVYTFDTKNPIKSITKHDAELRGFKYVGLTTELCGKLYALSYLKLENHPPFEVFDPELGRWEALAQPPHRIFTDNGYYAYIAVGTKIFVSNNKCPVYCFDVSHPENEWRMVSTMCGGGPFPFANKTLVLDIEDEDDNKKVIFALTHGPMRLHGYLMSLRENQETITEIGARDVPRVTTMFGLPTAVKLVHIGGNKACIVITQFSPWNIDDEFVIREGKHYGVVIPFLYELDMTKIDEDNCRGLTLDFAPDACCFEYHTEPCVYGLIEPAGCFLL